MTESHSEKKSKDEEKHELHTGKRSLLPKLLLIAGLFLIIGLAVGGVLLADWMSGIPVDQQAVYVGRESCIKCHEEQAHLFKDSYHDLAMDLATSETVLASFDGEEIEHFGITSKVFQRDGKYFVNTEGPDGKMSDFEVKYVFGVSPLQQYMVELEPPPKDAPEGAIGRVQVLRLSWDTKNEKWFYLSPPDVDAKLDPVDPLHWTGITQCWNASCADCHSTNLQKNFDHDKLTYATTFSEIDVSCEACHGPGSNHVEIAQNKRIFWDRNHGKGLVKLKGEDTIPQIEACAKCHSRRAEICSSFKPGKPFLDHYSHELLMEQTYHHDGQIKDEDYVYGSFLQSKMFQMGIRCTDCHDPHSTKVKFEGNQLCTSCHQHPAGKYDTPAHHQHKAGSTGASCVECHMPATTYMEVDPRRDHSIRVPRPDLSVKLGTPNACTACHINEESLPAASRAKVNEYADWLREAEEGDEAIKNELKLLDQWAAAAVKKWYGDKEYPQHFAEVFIEARKGEKQAIDSLANLARDQRVPGIVRATSISELNRFPSDKSIEIALDGLKDNDQSVVASAIQRISADVTRLYFDSQQHPDRQRRKEKEKLFKRCVNGLVEKLDAAILLVRTQAARALISVPELNLTESERKKLDTALLEFVDAQLVSNDRERAHLVLGSMYEEYGRTDKAIHSYLDAIRVEPSSTFARRNLAAVYDRQMKELISQGQRLATQRKVEEAKALGPKIGEVGTKIEKLRNEEFELLKTEIERIGEIPAAGNLYYQFGMASYLAGNLEDAEKNLKKAIELQEDVPRFKLALAYFYQHQEEWEEAFTLKNQLLEIDPENREYLQLEQQLLEATRNLRSN